MNSRTRIRALFLQVLLSLGVAVCLQMLSAEAGDLRLHAGAGYGYDRFYLHPRHYWGPYAPPDYRGGEIYRHRPFSRRHESYLPYWQPYPPRYLAPYPPFAYQRRHYNPSSAVPPEHPSYDSAADKDAWIMLGLGQPDSAQQVFASLSQRYPESGRYLAGYALASAARGGLPTGAWAMRRALVTAPLDIQSLKPDAQLQSTLQGILYSYQGSTHPDAKLMRATLYYVLGNPKDARAQTDSLKAAGDRSESLLNLQRMIEERAGRAPTTP